MTLITTQIAGYLDEPYLTEPYLGGSNYGNSGLQFQAVIDAQVPYGLQYQVFIGAILEEGLQFLGTLDGEGAQGVQIYGVINVEPAQGLQYQTIIDASPTEGVQFEGVLDGQTTQGLQLQGVIAAQPVAGLQYQGTIDATKTQGLQYRGVLDKEKTLGLQAQGVINMQPARGLQFQAQVVDTGAFGIEFRSDHSIAHFSECMGDAPGYLGDAYLSDPYLVATSCAHMGLQFRAGIARQDAEGLQALARIESRKTQALQFRGIINATKAYGLQFIAVNTNNLGLQFNVVLYNTDNLRILCDFPSRGTTGENWTSNSVAPGDFSPYNLNTDIVEQVTRTGSGVTTGWQLTCDTEVAQGVFLDTLGILNHNLTTSATLSLLGSNDPTFSTIGVVIPLEVRNDPNVYYVAPDYPTQGYRYWRFLVDDFTNPAGYLEIGTIVFGSSIIFQGECFVDEVDYGFNDFADTVRTAGHTNVSNSRALKKVLGLEFRFLNFINSNFRQLRAMFVEDRTVYKCLWLPTPDKDNQEYTARFALFGKLKVIPRERHKTISRTSDYVSFTIEVDESL